MTLRHSRDQTQYSGIRRNANEVDMYKITWSTQTETNMTKKITFFLEIKPHPQERIRFHFRGYGKRRQILPYTPEKTRDYQNGVRDMVRQFMQTTDTPEFPKDVPLELQLIFYLPRPKSAKKRLAPTVRPDLSNYIKSTEDGLQRAQKDDTPALIEDDSSICRIVTEKRYVDEDHPEPGILVTVSEWTP